MKKYGVCKTEKEAGMGPAVGYCEKCQAPIIVQKDGLKRKTCDCSK